MFKNFMPKFKHTNDTMRTSWRFIFFLLSFHFFSIAGAQSKKFHFTEQKMGSPFNLVFVESDSIKAASLAKECFLLVDSLAFIFSDYDSSSELSKLNERSGTGPVKVSPALLEIILLSKYAYASSKHSFDISIGPLSLLWRKSRKDKQFPTNKEVLAAKKLVGFPHIEIDSLSQTVSLKLKGMRLDLGGIAKGYIAEKTIQFLNRNSAKASLVDAGGDISMSNAPPNSKGWLIGINAPEQTEELLSKKLQLANKSVATSGDAYQFYLHHGKKYSHITNPLTGYPVSFQRNVTVVAKDGATADWLATACSILPIDIAINIVEKEKAAVLITTIENNQIKAIKSKGFDQYWKIE
jgi:FAD:protein FMN transferase